MSDTFLSRWARRKQSVRAAERSEAPVPVAEKPGDETARETNLPGGAPSVDVSSEALPEGPCEDGHAPLPSLDALTPDSDLTLFLRQGVPAALRKAALRRMWSLDPAIRDFVSEAREYAYDWNTPGGVPGMGPLLPTDDVKAMLKRVVEGVPQPIEQPTDRIDPIDAERPPDASEQAATLAVDEVEQPSVIADAATQPGDPSPHVSPRPSVEDEPPYPARIEEARSERPRLRRHGGAMPS